MASSTLTPLRQGIADAITAAGIPAYAHLPERLTPPAVAVMPDEPYVSGSQVTACGSWRIRCRVVLLGAKGTNAAASDQLDALIETLLSVLDALAVDVLTVAEPVDVDLNGATYPGTVVTVESLQQIGA